MLCVLVWFQYRWLPRWCVGCVDEAAAAAGSAGWLLNVDVGDGVVLLLLVDVGVDVGTVVGVADAVWGWWC